jgi:hypothetical protein
MHVSLNVVRMVHACARMLLACMVRDEVLREVYAWCSRCHCRRMNVGIWHRDLDLCFGRRDLCAALALCLHDVLLRRCSCGRVVLPPGVCINYDSCFVLLD